MKVDGAERRGGLCRCEPTAPIRRTADLARCPGCPPVQRRGVMEIADAERRARDSANPTVQYGLGQGVLRCVSIELPENETLWRDRPRYSSPARIGARTVIVGSMVAIRNC